MPPTDVLKRVGYRVLLACHHHCVPRCSRCQDFRRSCASSPAADRTRCRSYVPLTGPAMRNATSRLCSAPHTSLRRSTMRSLTKAVVLVVLPALVGLAGCTRDVPTSPVAVPTRRAWGRFRMSSPGTDSRPRVSRSVPGPTFYVASLATGAIYRGDARTGEGSVVVPALPGRSACGVKYDPRGDRLFVAGSATGQAYVYDASTGATIAVYQLADPTAGRRPSTTSSCCTTPCTSPTIRAPSSTAFRSARTARYHRPVPCRRFR